jgi:hypothetical protein
MTLFYIGAALYPALVFCGIIVFKIPPRIFSLFLAAAGLAFVIGLTGKKKIARRGRPALFPVWESGGSFLFRP